MSRITPKLQSDIVKLELDLHEIKSAQRTDKSNFSVVVSQAFGTYNKQFYDPNPGWLIDGSVAPFSEVFWNLYFRPDSDFWKIPFAEPIWEYEIVGGTGYERLAIRVDPRSFNQYNSAGWLIVFANDANTVTFRLKLKVKSHSSGFIFMQ